jgi:hypothetical protein
MSDSLLDFLGDSLTKNLLRYAVQRQIFCPQCEQILDMRRASLYTVRDETTDVDLRTYIVCQKCEEHLQETIVGALQGAKAKATGHRYALSQIEGRATVTDRGVIWQTPEKAPVTATQLDLFEGEGKT